MIALIEIVIALIVVGILLAYINYVLGFLTIIPPILMVFITFAIAIEIVLFIIHRK